MYYNFTKYNFALYTELKYLIHYIIDLWTFSEI